jgi:L-ascorbate metabolism protein UlaG (beta-lactamase superfamily)
MDNELSVIYIGGPTIIIEISGLRFMTDPTLDPAGGVYHEIITKTESPAKIDIGTIDIVLLSHDQHLDNLDYAGRLLVEKVSRTYTTVDAAQRLQGTSVGLSPWQSDNLVAPDGSEITVTATPARHGPAEIEKIYGEVTGFILLVKGGVNTTIYITGDTVYYEGVAEVAKKYDPKYVFIFAGAAHAQGPFNVTMATNDALDTAYAFPCATIIPLHYNG